MDKLISFGNIKYVVSWALAVLAGVVPFSNRVKYLATFFF